jgi:signal peptidase I
VTTRPPWVEPTPDEAAPATDLEAAPDDPLIRLRARAQEGSEDRKARRSFWREVPLLVLIALVVAVVIKTFLVQAFFIESGSMRDTLLEGDRVMVNKLSYRFAEPQRGDIVVFDPPGGSPNDGESFPEKVLRNISESIGLSQPASEFIKRVIATEGETIEIRSNQVLINGSTLAESYLPEGTTMPDFDALIVPNNHVFVMGDNRAQSRDSRSFGTIPVGDIVGRAFITVWPPSRWDGL